MEPTLQIINETLPFMRHLLTRQEQNETLFGIADDGVGSGPECLNQVLLPGFG